MYVCNLAVRLAAPLEVVDDEAIRWQPPGPLPETVLGACGELRWKVSPQTRAWLDRGPFAFFLQCLCHYQAVVFVREDGQATVFARNLGAKLPQ